MACAAEVHPAFRAPDFDALNRYGWSWSAEATVDENYMDLAYLVARNSTCKDGHMGCALVEEVPTGGGETAASEQVGCIALCTINTALFGAHRSDCHAEANAVAESAARGLPLRGLSCYVTRAPCTACYKLLASAGVRRIVAPQALDSPDCIASATVLDIECRVVQDSDARAACRRSLGTRHEDMERVRALREERKRLRKEGTFGKKAIRKHATGSSSSCASSDILGNADNTGAGAAAGGHLESVGECVLDVDGPTQVR